MAGSELLSARRKKQKQVLRLRKPQNARLASLRMTAFLPVAQDDRAFFGLVSMETV
jgi:hypothetical protein